MAAWAASGRTGADSVSSTTVRATPGAPLRSSARSSPPSRRSGHSNPRVPGNHAGSAQQRGLPDARGPLGRHGAAMTGRRLAAQLPEPRQVGVALEQADLGHHSAIVPTSAVQAH
jgi:hypothetical protein